MDDDEFDVWHHERLQFWADVGRRCALCGDWFHALEAPAGPISAMFCHACRTADADTLLVRNAAMRGEE